MSRRLVRAATSNLGVSVHWVDAGIDTGAVLIREPIPHPHARSGEYRCTGASRLALEEALAQDGSGIG